MAARLPGPRIESGHEVKCARPFNEILYIAYPAQDVARHQRHLAHAEKLNQSCGDSMV